MTMEAQKRFTTVFNERLNSLLSDGYCKRVDSRLPNLWFVRLKHMANGNDIKLCGYPMDGVIAQWTNHILTHKEIV